MAGLLRLRRRGVETLDTAKQIIGGAFVVMALTILFVKSTSTGSIISALSTAATGETKALEGS